MVRGTSAAAPPAPPAAPLGPAKVPVGSLGPGILGRRPFVSFGSDAGGVKSLRVCWSRLISSGDRYGDMAGTLAGSGAALLLCTLSGDADRGLLGEGM
eukprot:CAMPEP_0206408834 /NCGR_PEP_ID=MMETSP0294-20121207/31435_1 /ASSEMBLY_ACC=CAM_ASM_000327 /TAXON_ID=39354 /ORGANISM="Heterosigma akashiwo, Strain CCMP2393" /LENGTH=97 /DNA_ID=CAMNT_0053868469 /DNA_START=26 /DNA_END=319 /DNA_ORIENTATION=-